MDPVKVGISFCVEAFRFQHLDTTVRRLDIWVELIAGIFGRMYVGHWRFVRAWIGCHLYFVVQSVPVGSLRQSDRGRYSWVKDYQSSRLTIITTPLIPLSSASSPHFFQYEADSHSSPNIMVEPWEKKWTGVSAVVHRSAYKTFQISHKYPAGFTDNLMPFSSHEFSTSAKSLNAAMCCQRVTLSISSLRNAREPNQAIAYSGTRSTETLLRLHRSAKHGMAMFASASLHHTANIQIMPVLWLEQGDQRDAIPRRSPAVISPRKLGPHPTLRQLPAYFLHIIKRAWAPDPNTMALLPSPTFPSCVPSFGSSKAVVDNQQPSILSILSASYPDVHIYSRFEGWLWCYRTCASGDE